MISYIDASIVLRIALDQPGRLREWSEVDRGISSALISAECLRTLDRLRIRARFADKEIALRRARILTLIASLEIVELDAVVLERAAQPMPTELGTLDAVHLATALLWIEANGEPLVMATHDAALGVAAQAHGLRVAGVPPIS